MGYDSNYYFSISKLIRIHSRTSPSLQGVCANGPQFDPFFVGDESGFRGGIRRGRAGVLRRFMSFWGVGVK
jgi:hypothetical protein